MAGGKGWWARLGAWLDRVPLVWLLAIASWLALGPFFPDIFDLLMHAVPLALLAWRLVRQARQAKG